MPFDADTLIARRRMRSRISFWRALALVLGAIALVAVTWAAGSGGGFDLGKQSDHVARIRIEGMITGNTNTLKMLKELQEAKHAKALMVRIDSPGGTTAGSRPSARRTAATPTSSSRWSGWPSACRSRSAFRRICSGSSSPPTRC